MSDDKLYIKAAREARRTGGAERDESLWAEARSCAGGNEIEARNGYVNLRVAQLKESAEQSQVPPEGRVPVSSVDNHPDFISVAKYSARNSVDERHVIQSIRDGHYKGREVAGDWYIFIGKSRFATFKEKKASFFFENGGELADSGLPGDEPDNLVDLQRRPR